MISHAERGGEVKVSQNLPAGYDVGGLPWRHGHAEGLPPMRRLVCVTAVLVGLTLGVVTVVLLHGT